MRIFSASLLVAATAFFHLLACGGATAEPTEGTGSESEGAVTLAPKDACREGDNQVCGSEFHSSSSSSGVGTTVPLYQRCEKNAAGHLAWSKCPEPQPDNTPLVLVFDGAPVTYGARPAPFDLVGDDTSRATDWPSARTPWLAIDRDGNGRIDDGSELFGSMTLLGSGMRARNGFEALAELDTNHDGVVSTDDADFTKLVAWRDADGDRASSLSELQPVSGSIVRIELAYRREHRCTTTGNCEVERARFVYRDAAGNEKDGEVVDVHLRAR
ncbi:hypothetical protein BH11MYX4_BH11MYX4_65480 [soil metagenome]